jgi:hypothetical protein
MELFRWLGGGGGGFFVALTKAAIGKRLKLLLFNDIVTLAGIFILYILYLYFFNISKTLFNKLYFVINKTKFLL